VLHAAACRSLVKVVSAIRSRHGRIWGDAALLARIATGLACNDCTADIIRRRLDPIIRGAARQEGYRLIPDQERTVVMSTKGASASGVLDVRCMLALDRYRKINVNRLEVIDSIQHCAPCARATHCGLVSLIPSSSDLSR